MAVRPRPALELPERAGLRFLTEGTRHQVKMDVYGRLATVVLIAESPDEYRAACTTTIEAVRRLGGSAAVFLPDPPHGRGSRNNGPVKKNFLGIGGAFAYHR